MRMYTLLLVISGFAAGAGAVADDDRKEMDKFKGDWGAISYVEDGQGEGEQVAADQSAVLFTFEGDKITIWADLEDASVHGTIKLDPSQKLNTIDITFTAEGAGEKPQTIFGIYEFDGEMLKLCYGSNGVERPKEFKSKAGSKHIMIVFKRVKK